MSTCMRLLRTGTTKKPYYRLVVIDSRRSNKGAVISTLGNFAIRTKDAKPVLDEEKILSWLKKGAQPTNTVKSMLLKSGIWRKFKPAAGKP